MFIRIKVSLHRKGMLDVYYISIQDAVSVYVIFKLCVDVAGKMREVL
jgi:hypothetical protein